MSQTKHTFQKIIYPPSKIPNRTNFVRSKIGKIISFPQSRISFEIKTSKKSLTTTYKMMGSLPVPNICSRSKIRIIIKFLFQIYVTNNFTGKKSVEYHKIGVYVNKVHSERWYLFSRFFSSCRLFRKHSSSWTDEHFWSSKIAKRHFEASAGYLNCHHHPRHKESFKVNV